MKEHETPSELDSHVYQIHRNALINHWDAYLWSVDEDLNMICANIRARRHLEENLGLYFEEGMSFAQIAQKQGDIAYKNWMGKIEEVRKLRQIVYFAYNEVQEGRLIHVEASVAPVFEGNNIIGFSCGFQDNTEFFLISRLNQLKNELKSQVLKIDNIQELLWCVTDEILAQLHLEDAMILIVEGEQLKIAAAHGSKRMGSRDISDDLTIDLSQGITGHVASTGKSALVNDTSQDPRYFSEHFNALSEVAVPIIVKGRVLGVINCESAHRSFFKPVHLQLLEEVADVLSTRIRQIEESEKRQRLDQLHQSVLNSTPNSYLLINENMELISFNRSAQRNFNHFLQQQLQVGLSFDKFVPRHLIGEFIQSYDKALAGELMRTVKHFFPNTAHGRWVKVTMAPARNHLEKIFGVTMLIEDISGLKQNEQQIIEKNKSLEKTNSELDKFVYSVSHDLRAPLSSMMGLNKLIGMADTMQEVEQYSEMLQDAADSMDRFIRNILDYSRNSRIDVAREHFSLDNATQEALDKIRFMSGFDEVKINIDFQVDKLYNDQYRFGIILNNLLSNAVKYQDSKKDKRIINITSRQDGETLLLEVKDNGLGIEEKYLPNLFEMFFKASNHNTGSGLGLYILREAVDALGGNVDIASKIDEGTTVSLRFPKTLNQPK